MHSGPHVGHLIAHVGVRSSAGGVRGSGRWQGLWERGATVTSNVVAGHQLWSSPFASLSTTTDCDPLGLGLADRVSRSYVRRPEPQGGCNVE